MSTVDSITDYDLRVGTCYTHKGKYMGKYISKKLVGRVYDPDVEVTFSEGTVTEMTPTFTEVPCEAAGARFPVAAPAPAPAAPAGAARAVRPAAAPAAAGAGAAMAGQAIRGGKRKTKKTRKAHKSRKAHTLRKH